MSSAVGVAETSGLGSAVGRQFRASHVRSPKLFRREIWHVRSACRVPQLDRLRATNFADGQRHDKLHAANLAQPAAVV